MSTGLCSFNLKLTEPLGGSALLPNLKALFWIHIVQIPSFISVSIKLAHNKYRDQIIHCRVYNIKGAQQLILALGPAWQVNLALLMSSGSSIEYNTDGNNLFLQS